MKHVVFFLLGLLPIAACAHQPVAVEIVGLEQFQAPCPDEPPALSDQEALALAEAVEAALAMPNDTEAERALQALYINEHALGPMAQYALKLRACGLYERSRADGAVSLGARFNQIARDRR